MGKGYGTLLPLTRRGDEWEEGISSASGCECKFTDTADGAMSFEQEEGLKGLRFFTSPYDYGKTDFCTTMLLNIGQKHV